jgi:hypothetical protein
MHKPATVKPWSNSLAVLGLQLLQRLGISIPVEFELAAGPPSFAKRVAEMIEVGIHGGRTISDLRV